MNCTENKRKRMMQMFYIIENHKGQFLVKSNEDYSLTCEIENATVFNRPALDEFLEKYMRTVNSPIQIGRIHDLMGIGENRDFFRNQPSLIPYAVDDIIDFDGNLYEVEGVKNGEVQLSHEDGCDFSVEFEHIKLVCKAKDRKDN